ncbi:MAG: AMP-binding protein, partial [Acidimicrobiales bacterium]|nr:AMP-binding protein [Acidimicrobiales bacterium]
LAGEREMSDADFGGAGASSDDIGPDDPACLTFTSGSTGEPKAVVGRHGSLTHFLPWMSEEFGVGGSDRFSMLSGLSHDPLQRDMFWPLFLGAAIVVPDPDLMGSPRYLARWMRDQHVTVAHLTPAMGQLVTESLAGDGTTDTTIESLRVALFIGDVLTRGQVASLRSVAPHVRVVNMYGTTETQRASGYHLLDLEPDPPAGARPKETLPLGRGMPGSQLLVRTMAGRPAAIGEVGEVVMRSPHLAIGYWHDDELTATRFSRDPHGSSRRDQLYATGDLGRYRPDGSVEFMGRKDQQVQLRGFRIELGEIAAHLRAEPAVADAAADLYVDSAGNGRLIAYVVPAAGARIDAGTLVKSMRRTLPAHMVPSEVIELERLPLNPNGKLDRRALPAPLDSTVAHDRSMAAPSNDLERALHEIWCAALGRNDISVTDDFFAVGGHSLLATRVLAMIEDRLGAVMPVSVIFEHPTVVALAASVADPVVRARVETMAALRSRVGAMTSDEIDVQLASVVERGALALMNTDDESSKRETLLALLLAEEGLHGSRTGIERRDPSEPQVLSFAQERMWFLEQFETDTTPLVVRTIVAMHGALDVEAMRRSLDEIFRRHDVLRTVIVTESGDPRPVVLSLESMPLVELDVDGDLDALAEAVATESTRTFDLEHVPPIVVTLVRITDTHHVLSVVMHHVASDATSMTVFFRELAALYAAFRDGNPSPLQPLAVQYDDYAWWQRHAATEIYERQLQHWQQHLADLPVFEIPPDHTRPARHQVAGGAVITPLPGDLAARVVELSRRTGATTFMVLLAAFEVVAARHAGETDVVIGVPIAGRARPELEPLIGACLNTLVLRNELGDNPSFRALVERVRRTSLDAYDNQDVPFERLLAELRPPRDLSRTPLFQIFFNMTHIEVGSDEYVLPGLQLEDVVQPDRGSKFDLTMYVNEASTGTDLRLVYNRSLYEHAHMQRLVEQFVRVLEQVVADPDLPIDRLDLSTAADAEVLPDESAPLDRTWHGSVPDAVRCVAKRAPERLAVIDSSRSWSFGLLAMQMARLASWLRVRHVGRGDIVAIYGHRSGSLVWTVTGVLASGAAYVLLDPRYPASRLAQILRIAKPKAWVALDAAGAPPTELLAVLDELGVAHRVTLPETADLAELDAVLELDDHPADHDVVEIGPDDVACLTFTSGSTGVPKGVIGRHGSLTHFLPWMSEEFAVGEDDRFSMLSGLSHDPLQRDMFWPLWLGATIIVPDPESMATAGWLARWMRDHLVSVAHLTPAMGQLLTEGFQVGRSEPVPSLRRALF